MELFEGQHILNCTLNLVPIEKAFKRRKNILLYFGMSRSPACKQFLQILKDIYTTSKKLRLKMEVIYVPFDEDEETMVTNFTQKHGGWYAVQFGDPTIIILRTAYGITKVPSLVVLGEEGTVISRDGINDYEKYGMDVLVVWSKRVPT